MSSASRPITVALFNVSAGGNASVTVPTGEVWVVKCSSGTFGGDSPTDFGAIYVQTGLVAFDLFTFGTSELGNNSFTILTEWVLNAGDQIGVNCTATTTFWSVLISGEATTVY